MLANPHLHSSRKISRGRTSINLRTRPAEIKYSPSDYSPAIDLVVCRSTAKHPIGGLIFGFVYLPLDPPRHFPRLPLRAKLDGLRGKRQHFCVSPTLQIPITTSFKAKKSSNCKPRCDTRPTQPLESANQPEPSIARTWHRRDEEISKPPSYWPSRHRYTLP